MMIFSLPFLPCQRARSVALRGRQFFPSFRPISSEEINSVVNPENNVADKAEDCARPTRVIAEDRQVSLSSIPPSLSRP